jgi:hypothetical protein
MTEDEALQRGADAGWSLARTLQELCGDKAETAILAAAAALSLFLTTEPAEACRLHRVWHYPFPQRCGVVSHSEAPRPPRIIVRYVPTPVAVHAAPAPVPAPSTACPPPQTTVPGNPEAEALDRLKMELAIKALTLKER